MPAMKKGAAVGGVTGLLAGLMAVTFPPAGLAFGGGALLATTLLGASFGAWASALIGASVPDSRLEEYEDAVKRGQVLVVVEVRTGDAGKIENLIRQHHPEVDIGTDTTSKQKNHA